jgi:hypothetical protein
LLRTIPPTFLVPIDASASATARRDDKDDLPDILHQDQRLRSRADGRRIEYDNAIGVTGGDIVDEVRHTGARQQLAGSRPRTTCRQDRQILNVRGNQDIGHLNAGLGDNVHQSHLCIESQHLGHGRIGDVGVDQQHVSFVFGRDAEGEIGGRECLSLVRIGASHHDDVGMVDRRLARECRTEERALDQPHFFGQAGLIARQR